MTTPSTPKAWQVLNETLDQKRLIAKGMGGAEKIEKRSKQGQLNARQCIDALCDENSFQEIGTLVGSISYHGEKLSPCDALVGGAATINHQPVVICCEDFTVQGGSIGHGTNAKRVRLATLALEQNLPFIMLLDGAGARMSNALTRHPYGPNDLQIISQLIGKVPTISCIIGSSAGHGAVGAALMDLVIMLEDACLFTAGPPLVQAALGEKISKEALGGSHIHSQYSGIASRVASNIEDVKQTISHYLSIIGQPLIDASHGYIIQAGQQNKIYNILPADLLQPYDIKHLIDVIIDKPQGDLQDNPQESLLDNNSFLELNPNYAKAMVTGIARINGQSIAIIANQASHLAGSIDKDGAIKAADFIQTLDSFNLPFLFLADTPGVMSGSHAEKQGTLKAAAKLYSAQQNMQSPKIHITLRKAFGFASCVMAMNPFDHQLATFALPGVSLGGIPAKGGAQAAKMDKEEAELIQQAQSSGAWAAADALAYDEVIKPCEMRDKIIATLSLIQP